MTTKRGKQIEALLEEDIEDALQAAVEREKRCALAKVLRVRH